ncbi:hypothetical protein [Rhodanobacter sp. PCA2]|uniref:hypothetical protein n=1 Tax=Rhodanobacter sp. PCA2 TaxID=2006117 RepID=UPI0015E7A561|nr:hypothetical protein [Rhodanobacter sp. PCA2]MBA2077134.1 hypothetical protein [Rhodanobacter sp. PCA2]
MKNITIGHAGPNWRTSARARYYAERGDGDEYAFGATPADALKKLEEREAALFRRFDESLAEEIAFLALGAADVLKEHPGKSLDAHDGYMGFIGEVIRHAPLLSERWRCTDTEQFGGVWLYEVTERFGREWAEVLLNGTDINPSEQLESILDDVMEKRS